MKLHEGKCNPQHGGSCSRTHAYKCRACKVWFRNDPVDAETYMTPFKYYPYCSKACHGTAVVADAGYKLFAGRLVHIDITKEESQYVDATAHVDFDNMMKQTKELN